MKKQKPSAPIWKSGRIFILISFIIVHFFISSPCLARTVNVAVIESANAVQPGNEQKAQLFKNELTTLCKNEHKVRFSIYRLGSSASEVDAHALLDRVYAESSIDMVLVLDVIGSQVLGRHPAFAKPTFLPLVFNARLLGYPINGKTSGVKNLHYQSRNVDLVKELSVVAQIAPLKNVVLISDATILKSIGKDKTSALKDDLTKSGVNFTIIPWKGDGASVVETIPESTDTVLYGVFPTARLDQLQNLINSVNDKRIKSFSLSGESLLRMGALTANIPETDWEKLARQTAINIQEVLLGSPASELPVFFETDDRLMINMETAGAIGFSPGFDLLRDAVLINEDKAAAKRAYSLTEVAKIATETNLSIAAQRLATQASEAAITERKGALLPQLKASVSHSRRRETDYTQVGTYAENSTDGVLSLTVPLFSEKNWAAYAIQK